MIGDIRLPGPSDRLAIVGRTGSGKTVAAIWHLSEADFDERPWVILDFKNDELLNAIDRAELIDFGELPSEPGLYLLKVRPGSQEQVSEFFKQAWHQENIGILVDEGYMIDRDDEWFNACLTQGRSKKITLFILSQRPVWLSRFVFSEASYFQVFDLTHSKDLDKVREYIRDDEREQLDQELPEFHSFYYDVGRKHLETFGPVPPAKDLLLTIDERLAELEEIEEYGDEGRPRRRAI
jgi:DNA helicase HerA-like ATPase